LDLPVDLNLIPKKANEKANEQVEKKQYKKKKTNKIIKCGPTNPPKTPG
jgi:hypothetical protein